jgi:MFS_1 like family
VLQGWYCFYWAGLVSITPYFNLYFKQRGLTDGQIGIISAARQWVSVPSSFLWVSNRSSSIKQQHLCCAE